VVRYLTTSATRGTPPPKPWTITADHLRGFGQSRLWGGGTVVVERDSFQVHSDSIDVESNRDRTAKFIGKPAIMKRIGNDSFLVSGSQIRLGFTRDTLRTVHAFGDGAVTRGTGTITGDSLLLGLEREKLARTDVWGRAGLAKVHSNGYDAHGDSIVIETPGEKLRSLRAFGNGMLANPKDTLHPVVLDSTIHGLPDRETLWGNRLLAAFEERDSAGTRVTRVSNVRAFGAARSWYAYNADNQKTNCPTLTYFMADTILVTMKSGDSTGVADVRYHGNVSGTFAERASVTRSPADTSSAGNPCRGRKP
jgi:hypothetical protein